VNHKEAIAMGISEFVGHCDEYDRLSRAYKATSDLMSCNDLCKKISAESKEIRVAVEMTMGMVRSPHLQAAHPDCSVLLTYFNAWLTLRGGWSA